MNPNPQAFADEWIAAWNSHHLERVLAHYASDIVFLSPLAQQLNGNGRVSGISALRSYWEKGLAAHPGLKFELLNVLTGHECLTIHYRNHRGQQIAETFEFGAGGKVVRSFACYA
jgi:ketosteroid isomerase-like protein